MIALHQQDILCNSRADELRDLLQFGEDVKTFLDTILFFTYRQFFWQRRP